MMARRLGVVAFGLTLVGCGGGSASGAPESPTVAVSVVTVTSETFADAIDAIGVVAVRPGHIASLGAPGAARVSAIRVAVGDRVMAGAVLVELDPAPFDATVQGATAVLLTATHAQERAQRLVTAGISPRKDLDVATSELAQASAAAASARRLRTLATVRSPIAGVITRLSATLGASVDGTAALVEVADPQFTDLVLAVSATEAARVTPGARVVLGSGAAHADDSLGTGVVSSVAAAIDSATRTVAVRVRLLQTVRLLRIGESVTGRITLAARANAVVVPAAAVVPDGDAFRLYVVDSTNVAHARAITVGARRNDRVEITTGVAVGERIVTDGAYQVDDGVHVAVRR